MVCSDLPTVSHDLEPAVLSGGVHAPNKSKDSLLQGPRDIDCFAGPPTLASRFIVATAARTARRGEGDALLASTLDVGSLTLIMLLAIVLPDRRVDGFTSRAEEGVVECPAFCIVSVE